MVLLRLFLCHILIVTAYTAHDDVTQIDIILVDAGWAWTSNTVSVTLWFNSTIYQYPLTTIKDVETHSTNTFEVVGFDQTQSQAKIMIENDASDGLIFRKIAFYTKSGEWYGFKGRCTDNTLDKTQGGWLYTDDNGAWVETESTCNSGTTNIWICVDSQSSDCGPYKQIFYFDISRPNQFINNALWSDATDVTPQIIPYTTKPTLKSTSTTTTTTTTIKPTEYSTLNPTMKPTPNPTLKPLPNSTSNHTVLDHDSTTTSFILASILLPSDAIVPSKWSTDMIVIVLVILICLLCVVCIVCCNYKTRFKLHHDRNDEPKLREQVIVNNNIIQDTNGIKDRNEVKLWLKQMKYEEYYPLFINNGFDSLQSICYMQNKDILKQIGIKLIGHQVMIWSHIKTMKCAGIDKRSSVSSVSNVNEMVTVEGELGDGAQGLPPVPVLNINVLNTVGFIQ